MDGIQIAIDSYNNLTKSNQKCDISNNLTKINQKCDISNNLII